jgi:DNA primase
MKTNDQTLDIVEVISRYITLRRLGSSYSGQCPFHATSTYDAFRVSPRLNIFKCFNCNETGGPVDFIQKMEGVDFKSALEILDLKEYRPIKKFKSHTKTPGTGIRDQNILTRAVDYWTFNLYKKPEGLKYLYARGIRSYSLIRSLSIGYAPPKGLYQHFLTAGYSKQQILDTGLVKEGENGIYDHFRNRVTFPVYDRNNIIRTVTSRTIDPEQKIKHLHLPGDISTFYNERNIDTSYVVLCEGIFDCLSLLQVGFNASALFGTGGLKAHMAEKLRKTNKIFLAFDRDSNEAGTKGLQRALGIFDSLKIDQGYPLELPFIVGKKMDMNDLFLSYAFTRDDFTSLMEDAIERKNCVHC